MIRPAGIADLPAISRIQAASPEAAQWESAEYLKYECLVAEEGGDILGFLVTRPIPPGESEILNLAVEPSARRRGVARELLKSQLARHPGQWFLEVRESNLQAIQLYESLGFRRAGTRKDYYYNPVEPGIVMKIDS